MEAAKDAQNRYRQFVSKKQMLINAAESAIQGLAFLVPSTLPDHELLTEACHALSGLFATFNHSITLPQDLTTSTQQNALRSLVSFALNLEVFAEKLGEKFGGRDAIILAIESLKAVLRLQIWMSNHQCMQTNGEKLEYDKPNTTWDSFIHFCDERQRLQREQQQYEFMTGMCEHEKPERVLVHTGARSGIQLRVPVARANDDILHQQQLREMQLQQSLHYLRTGEILHILRPVIYAALKYAMRRGHADSSGNAAAERTINTAAAIAEPSSRDWIPWVVSLLIELAALYCTAMAIAVVQGKSSLRDGKHCANLNPAHPFERELKRRKWLLMWYILRSPLFEVGVRPVLQTAAQLFGKTPLLGGLFRYATNLPEYLHRHHFYTAGSS